MVLERPLSPARRNGLRARAMPSLKELPLRRPQPPAPADSAVRWERVDPDRYEILLLDETRGYIDVVGAVFVVLAGPRYDRAVEVLQTLDFERAVQAVCPAGTPPAGPS